MRDNLADREFIIKYFEKVIEEFDKILKNEREKFNLGWCNDISYDILKPQYKCCLDKLRYDVNSGWEYRKVNNRNLYGGGA